MDGIYYDGINFARDGMQRVRKTIDRAASSKPFAPLIDMHTGNGGADAPPGVTYIAHMAYAKKGGTTVNKTCAWAWAWVIFLIPSACLHLRPMGVHGTCR